MTKKAIHVRNLNTFREKIVRDNLFDRICSTPIYRFEKAPPNQRQTDFLLKARILIVLGMDIRRGILVLNHRAYTSHVGHAIYQYLRQGYVFLKSLLNKGIKYKISSR